MLIDMIHDNHGELPFKTRYRDPAVLRAYGYQAIVIPDALAAIPGAYRGVAAEPGSAAGAMNLRSAMELEAGIDEQVKGAVAAGMSVYFYGDGLLLPGAVVKENPGAFLCEDSSGRLCPAKPAALAALRDQVRSAVDALVGVVRAADGARRITSVHRVDRRGLGPDLLGGGPS